MQAGIIKSYSLSPIGNRAVFDREKLWHFLRTESANHLPILENGELVGIVPLRLMREVFAEIEAGTLSSS